MNQQTKQTNSFQFLDDILSQACINGLTLDPKKRMMTSFVELGNLITEETTDTELINTLCHTLENIVYAQLNNFPENIFWDFDFMVSSMLHLALVAQEGGVAFLEVFGQKMVCLTEMFGIQNEIRFRYVHDFIYGFDWARWVQKDSATRAGIEPFSLHFLDYLLAKGKELLQRIDQGQSQSYNLCATGFRNPFTFSREPEDEYLLLTHLAQKQLIPVPAWNWYAIPVWNQPFQEMRQQLAVKLKIQTNTHS